MIGYSEALKRNQERHAVPAQDDGFEEFLMSKTLDRKRIERFGNPFGANALPLALTGNPELVRNLCVRVDAMRLAELDAVIAVLGCNKQEFVLEMLVSGLARAQSLIGEHGLKEVFEATMDEKIAEAGFSMVEAGNGYWQTHYKGKPLINPHHEAHRSAANAARDLIETSLPETGD